MLTAAVYIALGSIALALTLCMVRLMRGPHPADRVLAFDTLYINTIALLTVLGIYQSTAIFFEAALLIALTGFVATASLARFLARGKVME
ncbi:MAG: K+/H+ antiporter subunit F [Nitrospira sp.]|jgi:multicomponent K+:H+ antiporter subunit F|nr:K+/H+ antiporter subunit F [Nitrospira sp.]MDI3466922.1 Na(+) H(+) antiporter subunit F [Nitrospira sp.]